MSKKDSYDTMIKQMQANNQSMAKTVEESQRKIEKIMTIRKDNETQSVIGKRLHEIVDSCLEIDINRDEMVNFKRQKVDQETIQPLSQGQQEQIRVAQEMARQKEAAEAAQKAEQARLEEVRAEQARAE